MDALTGKPHPPAPKFFERIRKECIPSIDAATVPLVAVQNSRIVHDRTGVLYQIGDHHFELAVGIGKKKFWVTKNDLQHAREWFAAGYTNAMKSPDDTLIFVTPEEEKMIRKDQADCMGCLSQCSFSSWADNEKNTTGRLADPGDRHRPAAA